MGRKGTIFIAKTAWQVGDLTGDEAWMLVQIDSLCKEDSRCFASDAWFVANSSAGIATVKRRLSVLVAKGWVRTNGKRGRGRLIEIAELPPRKSRTEKKIEEIRASKRGEKQAVESIKNDTFESQNESIKNDTNADERIKIDTKKGSKTILSLYTRRGTKKNLLSGADASDTRAPALKLGKTKSPPPENSTAAPDDSKRASRLEKAILQAGSKLPRPFPTRPLKVRSWASAFRKLREVDEISPERIDAALKGYCRNITHDRAPQAWSGETFRAKFGAIEQFVRIRQQETPETKSEATLNPLVKEVLSWPWPVPLSESELSDSLDAAKEFGDTVRQKIREGRGKNVMVNAFLDHVSENLPPKFALGWHQWILNAVQKWSEWSGSLVRYRPAATCPLFIKWVRKLSQEFTLSEDAGKRFLKMFGDKE